MKFVLIHGSFGSPKEAWFPWLKKELEKLGHEVSAHQFPVDQWSEIEKLPVEAYKPVQNLESWIKTFEHLVPKIKQGKVSFVGHSLGPLFTLLMAEKYNLKISNAYFVAPFLYPATKEELKDRSVALIDKANQTFYHHVFDFQHLRSLISRSTVIYSNDDPYIAESESLEFAEKLGSRVIKLTGLGHMGIESNLVEFPQLLDAIKQDNS